VSETVIVGQADRFGLDPTPAVGRELVRALGRPGHVGRAGAVVGVDAGVRALAVLSRPVPGLTDAEGKVPNPRRLARVLARLRRPQRRAARRVGPYDPAARRGRRPSRRWEQTQRRLARGHGQVRDARADVWHQLTTALAQRFDTVVVEDLNVAGNAARNLARLVGHGTGSAPETGAGDGSNARGDPVRPTLHQRGGHESAKREARTTTAGKTGSLRPQGRSAPITRVTESR